MYDIQSSEFQLQRNSLFVTRLGHSKFEAMAAPNETYTPAFPPQTKPHISTGIPFPEACAHHIKDTFHASKVYIIISNSISKTSNFTSLQERLGDLVVGVRYGIKPHTPWDDVLEIVQDMREKEADIIVTLGAGSLTDGAKVISFVCKNRSHIIGTLSNLTLNTQILCGLDLLPAVICVLDLPAHNIIPPSFKENLCGIS